MENAVLALVDTEDQTSMKHKYRVTNENGETMVIICRTTSDLPVSFSCTEDGEIADTVKIERIE